MGNSYQSRLASLKSGSPLKKNRDMSKLASGDYAGYIGSIADKLAGMGGNFLDQLKSSLCPRKVEFYFKHVSQTFTRKQFTMI